MILKNVQLAQSVYQLLVTLQVEEIVICAGARNAPLVQGLSTTGFKIHSFFEERSASFFALGKIKSSQKPVAVITTSGTACSELLSGVIEAYYQGLPLIVVTADRPKNYRGTGAPQAIEQVDLFKNYVAQVYDWDVHQLALDFFWHSKKPLHINVCFDEPLLDGSYDEGSLFEFNVTDLAQKPTMPIHATNLFQSLCPLVIVGALEPEEKVQVKNWLLQEKILHYAEGLSGLLHDPELEKLQINLLENLFESALQTGVFNSVIRLGGIPTLKIWRLLENSLKAVPVIHISALSFSGLPREKTVHSFEILKELSINQWSVYQKLVSIQDQLRQERDQLVQKYPQAEPSLVFILSQLLKNSSVYVGNSLPIREWDLMACEPTQNFYANRGANGIDGQISTYLGWSTSYNESWCLVGDLTALYDLAALGLPLEPQKYKRVVVMNNSGGQIFKKVFQQNQYLNSHAVDFSAWAKMWNWSFLKAASTEELVQIYKKQFENAFQNYVIELRPQPQQTDLFWSEWTTIWAKFKF